MSPIEIRIDPKRVISEVDPRIYSGFTEHMGRCIYGGLYDPGSPLADPKTGFRKDVLEVIRSLRVPIVRYPGGNFVSSYKWQDGIGPRELRPRRPELAWLGEESNQFGTDEFMAWCKEAEVEPYICLNMGTGTLEDALGWVEYCNGTSNTYWASQRRKNGHPEPYKVKYWSLGNEARPWQVGQMTAEDYAKTAFQWAKALKLLDPSIELIACGETGYAAWDRDVLKVLAPMVKYHSLHQYTISAGDHMVNVAGPAGAEKGIQITKSLIELARIENSVQEPITICFDEWNVWDPKRAIGSQGAEEHYDLSDALAVACWLNVFIRQADIVKIACIAQSVNVISPVMTRPDGLFRQTTFYPLFLFANYMRGSSLQVSVSSPIYTGKTRPEWIQHVCPPPFVDVSAVLSEDGKEVRLAVVNRHPEADQELEIHFAGVDVGAAVRVYEVWHEEGLGVRNWFGEERVRVEERKEQVREKLRVKKHSFTLWCFTLLGA
ncbi:glycoside hydrolase family 51 protein [Dacryopinax primogenitus]|uniref:non-reducing end alpha-L-arabinofuranosidase n=1 Tax=Dacryopinax primogenitus (strain DJM 731) TaxID=1858805 RepID=M5FRS9_DACPD|nr:glycoside hydrolase family 51 protein [Dacryopinax primogenitus]EJT98458.1 glycoside hydrolase family 51 protein [Dacryopinax primogenitus]